MYSCAHAHRRSSKLVSWNNRKQNTSAAIEVLCLKGKQWPLQCHFCWKTGVPHQIDIQIFTSPQSWAYVKLVTSHGTICPNFKHIKTYERPAKLKFGRMVTLTSPQKKETPCSCPFEKQKLGQKYALLPSMAPHSRGGKPLCPALQSDATSPETGWVLGLLGHPLRKVNHVQLSDIAVSVSTCCFWISIYFI